MLALVLAVCTQFGPDYKPPAAAAAALHECGDESYCYRDLAEQFANGDGVTRDFDIAEYFLCKAEDDMAPAELEGMLEHLGKMRTGEETADLKFCDHVTSGRGMGECSALRHSEVMPEYEARLEKLPSSARFDELREKGKAYVDAEHTWIGEQSRGGTGYAAFTLEAEMSETLKLVEHLERYSKERAPAASAAEAKRADGELNAAYREAQKRVAEDIEGFGESYNDWKTLLRDAQRAWIAYRDAFAAYYAERWRGVASAEALKREIVTKLTRERTRELRNE